MRRSHFIYLGFLGSFCFSFCAVAKSRSPAAKESAQALPKTSLAKSYGREDIFDPERLPMENSVMAPSEGDDYPSTPTADDTPSYAPVPPPTPYRAPAPKYVPPTPAPAPAVATVPISNVRESPRILGTLPSQTRTRKITISDASAYDLRLGANWVHSQFSSYDAAIVNTVYDLNLGLAYRWDSAQQTAVDVVFSRGAPSSRQDRIGADYLAFRYFYSFNDEEISPFVSASALVGRYEIASFIARDANTEVYRRAARGWLLGLEPAIGLHWNAGSFNVETRFIYKGVLGNPAYRLGGFSVNLGVGIAL